MKTINCVEILGFAGRDAEKRSDKAPVKFSLATGHDNKPDRGKNPLVFHNIVVWDRPELLNQIKKGTYVRVTGRLDYSKWTGTDGVERTRCEIVADRVEILPKDSQPQPKPLTPNRSRFTPETAARRSRPITNAPGVHDDSHIAF